MAGPAQQQQRRTVTTTTTTEWSSDKSVFAYEDRGRFVASCVIAFWAVLLLISWILAVAALAREPWVTGTSQFTGTVAVQTVSYDVGLFKECLDDSLNGHKCFFISPSKSNIDAWIAASAFFVAGVILLSFAVIFAFVSLWKLKLINATKILHMITNVFMMVGLVLVPIGYAWLDDACPDAGFNAGQIAADKQGQCGLVCNGNNNMSFFSLCSPFEVGSSTWLMVAAIVILFIASFLASTIRLAYVMESTS